MMFHDVDELIALFKLKFGAPLHPRGKERPDLKQCYVLLEATSRSFASVIEQLHPELRDPMMIFYVILRGLDTIEDDTGLDNSIKLPILRSFRQVLMTEDWTFDKCSPTEKDRIVLEQFDVVLREYHRLRPKYQDIIADISDKMGNGMADYIAAENQINLDGVKTIADYDLYCHHVAGIVGEGITRMAVYAKFGTPRLAAEPQLYESMGLFLQKTNIIRDYREDIDDGRSFWPKEVWGLYTEKLPSFKDPANVDAALDCVAHLTLISLSHVTDCLEYLENIRDESLFRFCAIPQVMSIATLELVFNNPEVFQRNIKLRKGMTARLILSATSMPNVYRIFRDFVRRIHAKNNVKFRTFLQIEEQCAKIEQHINAHDKTCEEYRLAHSPNDAQAQEDARMNRNIVIFSCLSLVTVSGVMVLIAWLNGAALTGEGTLFDEMGKFVDFMLN